MTFIEGLACKDTFFVVPNSLEAKRLMLQDLHGATAGYFGVHKTLKVITSRFHWPGADKEVRDYIHHCPGCQLQLTNPAKPTSSLQSVQVPPEPFHTITIDHVTGLPETLNWP